MSNINYLDLKYKEKYFKYKIKYKTLKQLGGITQSYKIIILKYYDNTNKNNNDVIQYLDDKLILYNPNLSINTNIKYNIKKSTKRREITNDNLNTIINDNNNNNNNNDNIEYYIITPNNFTITYKNKTDTINLDIKLSKSIKNKEEKFDEIILICNNAIRQIIKSSLEITKQKHKEINCYINIKNMFYAIYICSNNNKNDIIYTIKYENNQFI